MMTENYFFKILKIEIYQFYNGDPFLRVPKPDILDPQTFWTTTVLC